jgi:hypothetical protein
MAAIFQFTLGKDYLKSSEYELALFLTKLVFPIKDFFIAISLVWLYTYQGLKKHQKDTETLDFDSLGSEY